MPWKWPWLRCTVSYQELTTMIPMNAPIQVSEQPSLSEAGPPLIAVEGLVKSFGDFTAVKNISFRVNEGEIFGFLGPNGAGKSTTIKVMCTLLRPTAGQVRIAGYDVVTQSDAVRSTIGIVF